MCIGAHAVRAVPSCGSWLVWQAREVQVTLLQGQLEEIVGKQGAGVQGERGKVSWPCAFPVSKWLLGGNDCWRYTTMIWC